MNNQTQEALKIGDRVVIKDTAGFSKRLHGIITDFKQDKFWVLRDGADKPVWFYPDELQLEEALAQPAQEPVAHFVFSGNVWTQISNEYKHEHFSIPLYTHPAPSCQECENLKHDLEGYMKANKALINREWQGLTSEEIRNLDLDNDVISVIFQTEKLLKEKNHG